MSIHICQIHKFSFCDRRSRGHKIKEMKREVTKRFSVRQQHFIQTEAERRRPEAGVQQAMEN